MNETFNVSFKVVQVYKNCIIIECKIHYSFVLTKTTMTFSFFSMLKEQYVLFKIKKKKIIYSSFEVNVRHHKDKI